MMNMPSVQKSIWELMLAMMKVVWRLSTRRKTAIEVSLISDFGVNVVLKGGVSFDRADVSDDTETWTDQSGNQYPSKSVPGSQSRFKTVVTLDHSQTPAVMVGDA
jgi:hypothetical protein